MYKHSPWDSVVDWASKALQHMLVQQLTTVGHGKLWQHTMVTVVQAGPRFLSRDLGVKQCQDWHEKHCSTSQCSTLPRLSVSNQVIQHTRMRAMQEWAWALSISLAREGHQRITVQHMRTESVLHEQVRSRLDYAACRQML